MCVFAHVCVCARVGRSSRSEEGTKKDQKIGNRSPNLSKKKRFRKQEETDDFFPFSKGATFLSPKKLREELHENQDQDEDEDQDPDEDQDEDQ